MTSRPRHFALGALAAASALSACAPAAAPVGCTDVIEPGDLVITEVFADYAPPASGAPGDAGKEWFEIFNASDHPIELHGLTITSSRQDDSQPSSHRMHEIVIAPGQYFTLGDEDPAALAPYVSYGYGTDLGELFNSGGGKLRLACGDVEIDTALYADVAAGHSRELTSARPPAMALTSDLASWCQGNATEFDHGNFGTPGQESDCEPLIVGQCDDGGTARAIVTPAPGDLVITEIMPSPAKVSDTVGEWFEAVAMNDVDLNGLGLDRAGDTRPPDVIAATSCLHANAGDVLVFARNPDNSLNGGLPVVSGTFGFAMTSGSTASPGDVQILTGTTVIDAVTWTRSAPGASLQLDPRATDPQANDDPSNFCDATRPYGAGDLGTPGLPNDACQLAPPAGMCLDQGTPRAIVAPTVGALVITEVMPNPAGDETKREWLEITNTGSAAFDLNGLGIDRPDDSRPADVIQAADCRSLPPGAYAVFARSTDAAVNAGLPMVDATFGLTLLNASGTIQILAGATLLDAVTWKTTTDGASLQLDPAHASTVDNDVPANFCLSKVAYGDGTNKGSPGAANVPCVP